MPRAVRRAAGPPVIAQPAARPLPSIVHALQAWHRGVNLLSGSMVLAFKDGVTPALLRDWAGKLRKLADEMETRAS